MASNCFGNIFKVTTWGESHGKAIGVVIDGCPAGVSLSDEDVNQELARRAPGQNPFMSPRHEPDKGEILSGVFEGKTTGTPISIIIFNRDVDSSKYEPIKDLLRPGHANFTYLEKYGVFDYRGGGRSSSRETACRVAAGAVAKNLLSYFHVECVAYILRVGGVEATLEERDIATLRERVLKSPVFCSDAIAEQEIIKVIELAKSEGDSLGGIVEFRIEGMPAGLGDPVYEKLEANLAKAMLSLPATKGFDIGEGFHTALMRGSEHNDSFYKETERVKTRTNHAGGTLGGISTGMPIVARVAFKPTSSIMKPQPTLDMVGREQVFRLPEGSRHDPCVAIRGVPVVEAMASLVVVDALLVNRGARL